MFHVAKVKDWQGAITERAVLFASAAFSCAWAQFVVTVCTPRLNASSVSSSLSTVQTWNS